MDPLIVEQVIIEHGSLELSLQEVCERCSVDAQTVIHLVSLGVAEPAGTVCAEWRFSAGSYLRIRKALRLQRDLALNDEGVALALELLERLDEADRELAYLRQRLARWES